MVTLSLPQNYPWVIGAVALGPLLTIWQSFLVSSARKQAGIKYPQVYATKEEEKASKLALQFNCTQRAHQNTLENLSQFFVSSLISGLLYPRLATGAAGLFIVGRIVYTLGYKSGDPRKRIPGAALNFLANITLAVTALTVAFKLVQGVPL